MLLTLTRSEVMNLPAALLTPELLAALRFAQEPLPAFPLPDTIRIGDVVLPLPSSPELGTFGQATDLGALLIDETLPQAEKRLRALAIYLYPLYYRCGYDSDQIDAFAELCRDIPLAQALPVTDFFLPSSSGYAPPTSSSSSPSLPALPSVRQVWRNWFRNGIRWPSWMRWPAATKPDGATSSA